jgi:hypothetical protein
MPCTVANPMSCPSGQYCSVLDCGNATGTCIARATSLTNIESPVCGCDGVSYWNATLASAAGVSLSGTPGECPRGVAKTCMAKGGCGLDLVCDLEVTSIAQCAVASSSGICWAMPKDCPGNISNDRHPCGAIGAGSCMNRCLAIKNQKEFFVDSSNCPN